MREVALVLPAGTSLTELNATTAGATAGAAPPRPGPRRSIPPATAAGGPSLQLKGCAERQPDVATLMVRLRRLYRAADVTADGVHQPQAAAGSAGAAPGRCPRTAPRRRRLPERHLPVRHERDLHADRPGREAEAPGAGPTRRWGMTLTDRDRKIAAGAGAGACSLRPTGSCCSRPSATRPPSSGDELAQAETARDDAVARADAVSSAKGGFAADFAEVLRIGKAIPSTVDMPSLLVQLDKAAEGTGIGFNSIKVGQRTDGAAARHPQRRRRKRSADGRRRRAGRERARRRPPSRPTSAAETSDQANAAAGADPAAGGTAAGRQRARASTPCRSTSPSAATSSSSPTSSTGSSASCT